MKPTLPAKIGLGLLVLGLATFLAVAIWLQSVRTVLMDIPMPMRAAVTSKDFAVDYDGPIYVMDVQFDQSVSDSTARCLLGATKSELRPDLDCTGIEPLLKFSWELRRDGQYDGSGSSADMGSISRIGGRPRVMIVGFPASRKHRYKAILSFEKNAGDLTIAAPRVQVELDSFVREDPYILGVILDVLGLVLCLVGVAMVAVPFFRSKFSR